MRELIESVEFAGVSAHLISLTPEIQTLDTDNDSMLRPMSRTSAVLPSYCFSFFHHSSLFYSFVPSKSDRIGNARRCTCSHFLCHEKCIVGRQSKLGNS